MDSIPRPRQRGPETDDEAGAAPANRELRIGGGRLGILGAGRKPARRDGRRRQAV